MHSFLFQRSNRVMKWESERERSCAWWGIVVGVYKASSLVSQVALCSGNYKLLRHKFCTSKENKKKSQCSPDTSLSHSHFESQQLPSNVWGCPESLWNCKVMIATMETTQTNVMKKWSKMISCTYLTADTFWFCLATVDQKVSTFSFGEMLKPQQHVVG